MWGVFDPKYSYLPNYDRKNLKWTILKSPKILGLFLWILLTILTSWLYYYSVMIIIKLKLPMIEKVINPNIKSKLDWLIK